MLLEHVFPVVTLLSCPRSGAHRYIPLNVDRNKPVRALAQDGLIPADVLTATRRVTAIKLRKKLPLLLERGGVTTARMQEVEQRRERLPRRIKIRKKVLFDPLILTFSRREKELSILNLMAAARRVGTSKTTVFRRHLCTKTSASRGNEHNEQLQVGNQYG